jgi:hypothetical protein
MGLRWWVVGCGEGNFQCLLGPGDGPGQGTGRGGDSPSPRPSSLLATVSRVPPAHCGLSSSNMSTLAEGGARARPERAEPRRVWGCDGNRGLRPGDHPFSDGRPAGSPRGGIGRTHTQHPPPPSAHPSSPCAIVRFFLVSAGCHAKAAPPPPPPLVLAAAARENAKARGRSDDFDPNPGPFAAPARRINRRHTHGYRHDYPSDLPAAIRAPTRPIERVWVFARGHDSSPGAPSV